MLRMSTRYDIRPDDHGWTVFDADTGLAAEVNGVIQFGLSLDDADDLADLLDHLDRERSASVSH
jgi:hypothetical protein